MQAPIDVVALEKIAARGWQGTSCAQVGDWLLRAAGGFTGRANSVLPLGSAGCSLDDALAEVAEFYAGHGLPPKFQMPSDRRGSRLGALSDVGELRDLGELGDLDDELQRRGWRPFDPTIVIVASLEAMVRTCPPSTTLPTAEFSATPSPGWLAGYHYRGSPLPAVAVEVLLNADAPTFATVSATPGGDLAGVGRGVVTDGWLGVTAVTVDQRYRRSGVGRHVMGELGRWALGRSAHSVYLQVDSRNTVAVAMYERLGFTEHHRYHYLAAPSPLTN